MCSEAGSVVAVSWPVVPGKHVEASVLAALVVNVPTLLLNVTVREPRGALPVVHVAVDGVVIESFEPRRAPVLSDLAGIYRAEIALPVELIDGGTHRMEVVVAATIPADETVPENRAVTLEAPVGYGSQELLFYAKRFGRKPRSPR
jgi:hypothetical protein